jgi:hypothetical protein
MSDTKQLERHAVEAHRNSESWTTFWRQHGGEVRRAEPFDRQRFNRLTSKLLALVVSGDSNGLRGIDTALDFDNENCQLAETNENAVSLF